MKNLVFTAIVVGVIGYFGAKFYLHHKVSSGLDTALAIMRPFADIQYEGAAGAAS